MIVIYSDDFLEKLRRPSNIVTIGSFSLEALNNDGAPTSTKEAFSNYVLNNVTNLDEPKYSDGLIGTLDTEKKIFSIRFDLLGSNDANFNVIRFYEVDNESPAFAVINDLVDDHGQSSLLSDINTYFGQTRNLINLALPEDAAARLETAASNSDLQFLNLYGRDLGENLYKIKDDGNIMITTDSYYKLFAKTKSSFSVDAVPFVRNDCPFIDADGKKYSNDYTYKVYKNLEIFCAGLENDCWIPTKYGLYESRDILKVDGIRLYGRADYDEYRVFGEADNYISSGTDSLENIMGLEIVEVENNNLNYSIDYNNNRIIYTAPGEGTLVDLNAYAILKARIRNYNSSENGYIESNQIRLYQGKRWHEWGIIEKSTSYTEKVNGIDCPVPVFVFPWHTDKTHSHKLVIRTTHHINKKSEVNLALENELLNNYFDISWRLNRVLDQDNKFKYTLIEATLTTKTNNLSQKKWNPLNENKESTLMLASFEYKGFKTGFYMVQSPRINGLRLYEFNPVGSNFSRVKDIVFNCGETEKVYWMLAEEKSRPTIRKWWTSYTSEDNKEIHKISVESLEYITKTASKNPKEDDPERNTIRRSGYGKFTYIPKAAYRPDVEITGSATSIMSGDIEMFPSNKYLTVFDSFSVDQKGYISLNNSKIVSSEGNTQTDSNTDQNIQVGSIPSDKSINPVSRSLTTYINNKLLGKEVSGITYKNATINNASNLSSDPNKLQNDILSNRDKNKSSLTTLTTIDGRTINTNTEEVGKIYLTDATVIDDFLKNENKLYTDRDWSIINGSTVDQGNSDAGNEDAPIETIQENTQDKVVVFIKEDGTIGYTSKDNGIAVKLVIDYEGRLIYDPRNIWDNRKLRPVLVTMKEEPKTVDDIKPEDPLIFYRVDEDDIDMFSGENGEDPAVPNWRRDVTTANISYTIIKKGQEPFIQIIGSSTSKKDMTERVYEGGRFVEKIKHAPSTDVTISYIRRNPITVKSNCPFKLSVVYEDNFEGTLEFDSVTKEMKNYEISTDKQTLLCSTPEPDFGRSIFIDVMEADTVGKVGKLVATYNDLTEESNIIAKEIIVERRDFKAIDESGSPIVDEDRLLIVNHKNAKNLHFESDRTLKSRFISYLDTVGEGGDKEPITITTPGDHRVPIKYQSKNIQGFRVSKISPRYDLMGYTDHSTTLDLEMNKKQRYPLDPVGRLTVAQYKKGFDKGENFYIYNEGLSPSLKIKDGSNIGILGGNAIPDPPLIKNARKNFEITDITSNNTAYSLNKWTDMEQIENRKIIAKQTNGSKVGLIISDKTLDKTIAKKATMISSAVKVDKNIGEVVESYQYYPGFSGVISEIEGDSCPVYLGFIKGESGYSEEKFIEVELDGDSEATSNYYKLHFNKEVIHPYGFNNGHSKIIGDNTLNKTIGIYLDSVSGFIFLKALHDYPAEDDRWVMINQEGLEDSTTKVLTISRTNYVSESDSQLIPAQYIDSVYTRDSVNQLSVLLESGPEDQAISFNSDTDTTTTIPWYPKSIQGNQIITPFRKIEEEEKYYSVLSKDIGSNGEEVWLSHNESDILALDQTNNKIEVLSRDLTDSYQITQMMETTFDGIANNYSPTFTLDLDETNYSFSVKKQSGEDRRRARLLLYINLYNSTGQLGTSGYIYFGSIDSSSLFRYVFKNSLRNFIKSDRILNSWYNSGYTNVNLFFKIENSNLYEIRFFEKQYKYASDYSFKADTKIYLPNSISSLVDGGGVYIVKDNRLTPVYDSESTGTTAILDYVKWPIHDQITIKQHDKFNNKIRWKDINLKDNKTIYGFFDCTGYISDIVVTKEVENLRFVKSVVEYRDKTPEGYWYLEDYELGASSLDDHFIQTRLKNIDRVLRYSETVGDDSVNVWEYFDPQVRNYSKILPVKDVNNNFTYYTRKFGIGVKGWDRITDTSNLVVVNENDSAQHYYYTLSNKGPIVTSPDAVVSISLSGEIMLVPTRWKNAISGEQVYTVPGAKLSKPFIWNGDSWITVRRTVDTTEDLWSLGVTWEQVPDPSGGSITRAVETINDLWEAGDDISNRPQVNDIWVVNSTNQLYLCTRADSIQGSPNQGDIWKVSSNNSYYIFTDSSTWEEVEVGLKRFVSSVSDLWEVGDPIEDKPSTGDIWRVVNIVSQASDILYTTNNMVGLDKELYSTIENPILWSAINTNEVTSLIGRNNSRYFKSFSKTPLLDKKTLLTANDVELTGEYARSVNLRSKKTFAQVAKYNDKTILDKDNNPVKGIYEYDIPVVSSSLSRKIKKYYDSRIIIGETELPIKVIECDDNRIYLRRVSDIAKYYPRVYSTTDFSIQNKQYNGENFTSYDATTFTVLSKYRLQYPKIKLVKDGEEETYKITSTPTKAFYQYSGSEDDIFDAVNIILENGDDSGEEISKALDVDIHVKPNYLNDGDDPDQPLFRITDISESYDPVSDMYSYNITVIPKASYEETTRRDCGSIEIVSRVHNVFNKSSYIPKNIIDLSPKVLPLYNDNDKVSPETGETRPLTGTVYDGTTKDGNKDAIDYAYEETVLPTNQEKIDSIAGTDTLTLKVYQQSSNILQVLGNKEITASPRNKEIYTTWYRPNYLYRYGQEETDKILLSPKTLKIKSENSSGPVHVIENNYDPTHGGSESIMINGVSYQYPNLSITFDDILTGYYPETPKILGSGIKSEYADSSQESIDISIEVGKWNEENRWTTLKSNACDEEITINTQSIPTCLVCETPRVPIKVYYGDNSGRNTIYETVSGKNTAIELFVGEFNTVSGNAEPSNEDCIGKSNFIVTKEDNLTTDWSYEILSNNLKLENNEGAITTSGNNLRITFSPNETEETLTRIFKITTQPKTDNDTQHEITLRVMQGSYLGTVYCDDTLRFRSTGDYFDAKKVVDTTNDLWKLDVVWEEIPWSSSIIVEKSVDSVEDLWKKGDNISDRPKLDDIWEVGIPLSYYKCTSSDPIEEMPGDSDTWLVTSGENIGTYEYKDRDQNWEKVSDSRPIYFETDIPASELEFKVLDDSGATVYLMSSENDTSSAQGIDFKKYKLKVVLSENNKSEKATKYLVFYRTYNMYDPKTGRLTTNKKEISRVKIVQGYCALILENPVYKQDDAERRLDPDITPEYVTSDMVMGATFDPLFVPFDRFDSDGEVESRKRYMYASLKFSEPGINGDFIDDAVNLGNYTSSSVDIQTTWVVRDPTGVKIDPDAAFKTENPYKYGTIYGRIIISSEARIPFFNYEYWAKDDYTGVELNIYISNKISIKGDLETINGNKINIGGRQYRFYSYLRKENSD